MILGQSPPSSAYNETGEGIPFFQGKVDFRRLYPIPRIWCTDGRKFADPGDVLISVRAPVGDVNVAADRCGIGRGLAAVRPGPDSDPWFLYFALLYSKPTLEARATGSTFASVNRSTLRDLDIPFFNKLTQTAIGRPSSLTRSSNRKGGSGDCYHGSPQAGRDAGALHPRTAGRGAEGDGHRACAGELETRQFCVRAREAPIWYVGSVYIRRIGAPGASYPEHRAAACHCGRSQILHAHR